MYIDIDSLIYLPNYSLQYGNWYQVHLFCTSLIGMDDTNIKYHKASV